MKDKQTPQLIVLGVLVALCVAFVVIKIAGGSKHTATKAQPQQAASQASTKAGAGESATAEVDSTVTAVQAVSSVPAARRDPFAPMLDVAMKNIPFTPAPRPYTPRTRVAMGSPNVTVPPLPVMPFGAGPQQASARAVPVSAASIEPQAEEQFPSFVLTGVITGRSNVAIIRLGDSRYIVKEGQLINGMYKVISVSPDGVQIRHDSRSVFLKLGGEENAS